MCQTCREQGSGENAQNAFTCEPGEGHTLAEAGRPNSRNEKKALCCSVQAWAALLGGVDVPAALGPRPRAKLQTLPVKEPNFSFPSSGRPATLPNSEAPSSSLRADLR